MEHPINKSTDATQNDPSLSVMPLIVVLALLFTLYFTVQAAVPELPLDVHHALVDLPWASEQAANAVVDASVNMSGPRTACLLAFLHDVQRPTRRGQG